jgi:hypothetical protein
LTSARLILLAALLTAAALAATVLVWRRRWVFVARPLGVLLAEVLMTLTVGLVVNRSQQFYPSWAALFASSDPGPSSYHTSAGRLDAWLAAQPGAGSAQSFPWRPSGWTGWHLAGPPTVTVPAGYLEHSGWRYSAVLVVGARPWAVPPPAGPTVLVSLTTTAATAASTLAVALPGLLGRDLRVTGHRWALVASAADGALARQVAVVGRGRFPAVAFAGMPAPAHGVAHPATRGAARPSQASSAATKLPPGQLPAGIQTAYFRSAAIKTAASTLAGPLRAALTWAVAQTPPPLAASAPEPTYLPPPPKRPHHKTPTGGTHGSGQPRP